MNAALKKTLVSILRSFVSNTFGGSRGRRSGRIEPTTANCLRQTTQIIWKGVAYNSGTTDTKCYRMPVPIEQDLYNERKTKTECTSRCEAAMISTSYIFQP
jgi:hypothetical protein